MQPEVRLALGSNLGDRHDHLARARESLMSHCLRDMEVSPILETEAVGPVQGPYLNQVVRGSSRFADARSLLERCLAIETELGRVRGERWGPRTIDIDLLTFAEEVIEEEGLVVPHPRIGEREFVLAPWAQLEAGYMIAPGTATVQQLLEELRSHSRHGGIL